MGFASPYGFRNSAEAGPDWRQAQLKQELAMVADDPVLDQTTDPVPTPSYSGANVFDLLNEPDPLVKYNLDWSKPETRDYVRRLYFLTKYGGTLSRDGKGWSCRVMGRDRNPASLFSEDRGYGNGTPESAIDGAIGAVSSITELCYKEAVMKELKERPATPSESQPNRLIHFLAVYAAGLTMGTSIAWAILHR